jgi:hypothetical protein
MDTAPSSGVGHGDGALIVCDRLVRIYSAEGIEVQALQGLDLVIAPGEPSRGCATSELALTLCGEASRSAGEGDA